MIPALAHREKFAVVIPVYNHERQIEDVVKKSLRLGVPVFVVDDGCSDGSCEKIRKFKQIHILRHPQNRGKGAALITGFAAAAKVADWAITIDADGQHNPEDALPMMRAIGEHARPIVVGIRRDMTGQNVPWTSRFGRKFSNFWITCSGGPRLQDSQSGFRIYPLAETLELNVAARRFQYEIEILVKACWKHIPVVEVPVGVCYAPAGERISHFRPFVDFLRNTYTFSRLITRRLLVHPFVGKR